MRSQSSLLNSDDDRRRRLPKESIQLNLEKTNGINRKVFLVLQAASLIEDDESRRNDNAGDAERKKRMQLCP